MNSNKNRLGSPSWWHLGATGLLQPLSEDFLYRSPQRAPRSSWRRAGSRACQGGRSDA